MSETQEQLAVVRHKTGHALVGAVAGSGKTRTLIARIIHNLQMGTDPKRMLVLMFNRSAMEDFERRLRDKTRESILPPPRVRTFHAFGKDVCDALAKAGLIPVARLVSHEYELRKIMREVLEQANAILPDTDRFDTSNNEVLADALAVIDDLKNSMIINVDSLWRQQPSKWRDVFSTWEKRRTQGSDRFRSFTDLMFDPVQYMLDDEKVLQFVTNHYDEVLVDEFQDVNELQVAFLRHIAGTRARVIAVGDEDQCIYGFRAARPEYMTYRFSEVFPGTIRYSLSVTFRYGHEVAILANNSIRHNKHRTDKLCVSAAGNRTRLNVLMTPPSQVQNEVIRALRAWQDSGRRLDECAILLREFSHGSLTETALMKADIPYRLVGAPPFLERREILAMRAALVIAMRAWDSVPSDELKRDMLEAVLTVPPLYIKRSDMDRLIRMAMASHNPHETLLQAVQVMRGTVKGYAGRHYEVFCKHIEFCMSVSPSMPAAEFLLTIIDRLDLATIFMRNEVNHHAAAEKLGLLHAFTSMATKDGLCLADFMALIDMLASKIGRGNEEDSVLMTSIHRTKGLEFPHVIIPELSDACFPSDHDNLEDERRLFYVAVTRAIELLTLLPPQDPLLPVWLKDRHAGSPPGEIRASRFLYEASPILARDAALAIEQGDDVITPAIIGADIEGWQARTLSRYIDKLSLLESLHGHDTDHGPEIITNLLC